MIGLLKEEVERKLGTEIRRRGECQLLSDAILQEQGETLNYNTLRRFFGVDKKSNVIPSRNTLDILSVFLGYSSYIQFTKQAVNFGSLQYQDEWFSVLNSGEEERIVTYLKKKRTQSAFTDIFIRSMRELILTRRIQTIDLIFKSKSLGIENFSYSESVYVGNAIGILLRDVELSEKDYQTLLSNKTFVGSVVTIFVDYVGLNQRYGRIITLANNNSQILSPQDFVFFECLNNLRAYLMNQKNEKGVDVDFETFKGHPILIGRIAAVQILHCERLDIDKFSILEKLEKRFSDEKVKRIDYFYEVNIVALIMADFELMEILGNIQTSTHIMQQYQINHNQLSCIVNLMLAISNGNNKEIPELIDRIKPSLWVTSYFEFFDLFFQIALNHTANDLENKKKHKEKYLRISNKMNYQKFNKDYLKNYFV
jgi:hypothetical protein|uniref:hypothetical protein n=1 Tax=Fluviicola sp. TaxID=1917219 RepID=UPI00404B47D1